MINILGVVIYKKNAGRKQYWKARRLKNQRKTIMESCIMRKRKNSKTKKLKGEKSTVYRQKLMGSFMLSKPKKH
ncbi:MAG: hypothetical protein CVU92_11085 [Firmicutes bacterium HGW-Firmicutes-17]|nr:MAG: hypothetical protein CVU92_11085 [Firmicutes bacterium HGW-Firmicutes-17]